MFFMWNGISFHLPAQHGTGIFFPVSSSLAHSLKTPRISLNFCALSASTEFQFNSANEVFGDFSVNMPWLSYFPENPKLIRLWQIFSADRCFWTIFRIWVCWTLMFLHSNENLVTKLLPPTFGINYFDFRSDVELSFWCCHVDALTGSMKIVTLTTKLWLKDLRELWNKLIRSSILKVVNPVYMTCSTRFSFSPDFRFSDKIAPTVARSIIFHIAAITSTFRNYC